MKVYSFRAECEGDVSIWLRLLPVMCPKHGDVRTILYPGLPDVTVEVQTEASADILLNVLRCVPDGHVMVQTFRPVPLKLNSLERDYNVQ